MMPRIPSDIKQLIAKYKPEKVILFGSRAWGTSEEYSDYDLLVIKDTPTRRINRREEAMDGIKQTVPLDLIIVTPEEIDHLLKHNSKFLREILTKGMTIYERREPVADVRAG